MRKKNELLCLCRLMIFFSEGEKKRDESEAVLHVHSPRIFPFLVSLIILTIYTNLIMRLDKTSRDNAAVSC